MSKTTTVGQSAFVKCCFVFIILITVLPIAYGQNFHQGEIIQNGVTKSGYIRYLPKNSDFNSVEFKEQPGDAPVTLTAKDVQEFRLTEFETRIVSVPDMNSVDAYIFAEIVMEGPASLAVQSKDNQYVIIKDGQYLNLTIPIDMRGVTMASEYQNKRLLSLREVGKVRTFLADCLGDVKDNVLTSSLVMELINQYNVCKQQPSRIRQSKRILLEPVVRPALLWMSISSENRYLKTAKFDPSLGISYGVNLSFTSGSAIDRSVISVGLLHSRHTIKGSSSVYVVNDDATVKSKFEIQIERYFLPFSLKKYRSFGQRGLYYGASITPYVVRSFKSSSTYAEYENGVLVSTGKNAGYLGYHSFGSFLSLTSGFDVPLTSTKVLLLGLSFDYDPAFLERNQGTVGRAYALQLNLGIRL
jgi:hypothetical protein